MYEACRQMPLPFAGIFFDEVLVKIKEVTLVTMSGDIAGTNGLLFNNEFGSLYFQKHYRFLIVIFFDLVFRLGVGKNSSTYFIIRLPAPYKTIINFLAVGRLSLFDDHKKSL